MPNKSPDLPASNLLRFLLSYGPEDSNTNLFDEKVTENAERYRIKPIELSVKYVEEIIGLLRKQAPCHVLIAGVAGDGKSYHLRQVWTQLGGSLEKWQESGDLDLAITLEDGRKRTISFIKDLSAGLTSFETLWRMFGEPDRAVVMACNHGQILSKLRLLDTPQATDFANALEDTFFNAQASGQIGPVRVFDLSRVSQSERLLEIIQKIATHPGWTRCDEPGCPLLEPCLIRKNLDALWDRHADKPTMIAKRLCALVELAGLNGNHFPIRELFMLVVNTAFGIKRERSGGLGNCHFVQKKCSEDKTVRTARMDLFSNLLGNNMTETTRKRKELFRHLADFEVGAFGHPFFDRLILLGHEDPREEVRALYQKYLGDLPRPKAIAQDSSDDEQSRLHGAASEAARLQRAQWLAEARRRIFFRWNERKADGSVLHEKDLWSLTAYPHAADYLELVRECRANGGEQEIPPHLIAGLNRIMTGSASCTDSNSIALATNGADSRDPVGLLVVGKISTNMDFSAGEAFMVNPTEAGDVVPQLQFRLGSDPEQARICFDLTPRRYEFLANLEEGMLPTSFSKQIQSEFYALKALLVRAALARQNKRGKKLKIYLIDDEHPPITIKLPANNSHD